MTTQKDQGVTGRFEVTLLPINKLIYSKTVLGQGKCESPQERDDVIEKIEDYLENNRETIQRRTS